MDSNNGAYALCKELERPDDIEKALKTLENMQGRGVKLELDHNSEPSKYPIGLASNTLSVKKRKKKGKNRLHDFWVGWKHSRLMMIHEGQPHEMLTWAGPIKRMRWADMSNMRKG